MAHLTLLPRQADTRGQLFIIGAIALAVAFVALTMLLNTAIYTENMSARSDNVEGMDVQELTSELSTHTAKTMDYIHHSDTASPTDFKPLVNDGWGKLISERYASSGVVTSVRIEEINTAGGTPVIAMQTEKTTFHGDGGGDGAQEDWRFVDNTEYVRGYVMDIDVSSLAASSEEAFTVDLTGSGGKGVYMYSEYTNQMTIESYDGADCVITAEDGTARVDLTSGTVNGASCEALEQLFPVSSNKYHIDYINSHMVSGTWEVIVPDSSVITGQPDAEYAERNAVYDALVQVSYADRDNTYTTEIRVAPGEHE